MDLKKIFLSLSTRFFFLSTSRLDAADAPVEGDPEDAASYDKDAWCTPRYIFRAANMRWSFDADAAATVHNSLCRIFFRDGLNTDWHKFAKWVWCNPPYSQVEKWIAKALLESYMGCGSVLLIPTHNGTLWWSEYVVGKASHFLLVTGRILFLHPTLHTPMKPAPFASCFVVYSPNPTRAPVKTILEDFVLSKEKAEYDEPALLRRIRQLNIREECSPPVKRKKARACERS